MQDIIIAKPYEFVPPARGTFWPAVIPPAAPALPGEGLGGDPLRHRRYRDVAGDAAGRAGVLLVPNHCRPCDPMVVTAVAGEGPRRSI